MSYTTPAPVVEYIAPAASYVAPAPVEYLAPAASRVFDSSATNSDHWGLTATIKSKRAETQWKKTDKKPIRWECRDRVRYIIVVRVSLDVDGGHLAQPPRSGEKDPFALYLFTDGSARKISRIETCAGLGFTAMKSSQTS